MPLDPASQGQSLKEAPSAVCTELLPDKTRAAFAPSAAVAFSLALPPALPDYRLLENVFVGGDVMCFSAFDTSNIAVTIAQDSPAQLTTKRDVDVVVLRPDEVLLEIDNLDPSSISCKGERFGPVAGILYRLGTRVFHKMWAESSRKQGDICCAS